MMFLHNADSALEEFPAIIKIRPNAVGLSVSQRVFYFNFFLNKFKLWQDTFAFSLYTHWSFLIFVWFENPPIKLQACFIKNSFSKQNLGP